MSTRHLTTYTLTGFGEAAMLHDGTRARIQVALRHGTHLSCKALAGRIGVCMATTRRKVSEMLRAGLVRRVG